MSNICYNSSYIRPPPMNADREATQQRHMDNAIKLMGQRLRAWERAVSDEAERG